MLAEVETPPYQAFWRRSLGTHRFKAEGVTANGLRVVTPEVKIFVGE